MGFFNANNFIIAILLNIVMSIDLLPLDNNEIESEINEVPLNLSIANLTACDCGWRNSQTLGIVGGQETGINEFPGMAALININSRALYCGGHIISDRYLLTAGHCVNGRSASSIGVLVGDHNISTGFDTPYSALYMVNAYEIYPYYNPTTYTDDIAILQTTTQITFSTYVAPICLPFRYATASFSGQYATALGWGQLEFSGPTSDTLQKVQLGVITNTVCNQAQTESINTAQLCTYANGKDTCQSDSGGPLLWTDTSTNRMHLIGIISHGLGCASSYPGINTRVTSYLQWIIDRTSDASYCYK